MKHTRITPRVIERINESRRHPKFGTPEYAAHMRQFVKSAEDRAMERAPALKPNPDLAAKRIQSLGILIAVELAKQGNDIDNLGDNESIVLMDKCPTINLVQLAERIDEFYSADVATIERRINEIVAEIEFKDEAAGADL